MVVSVQQSVQGHRGEREEDQGARGRKQELPGAFSNVGSSVRILLTDLLNL